jgi:hypothetical protein
VWKSPANHYFICKVAIQSKQVLSSLIMCA